MGWFLSFHSFTVPNAGKQNTGNYENLSQKILLLVVQTYFGAPRVQYKVLISDGPSLQKFFAIVFLAKKVTVQGSIHWSDRCDRGCT